MPDPLPAPDPLLPLCSAAPLSPEAPLASCERSCASTSATRLARTLSNPEPAPEPAEPDAPDDPDDEEDPLPEEDPEEDPADPPPFFFVSSASFALVASSSAVSLATAGSASTSELPSPLPLPPRAPDNFFWRTSMRSITWLNNPLPFPLAPPGPAAPASLPIFSRWSLASPPDGASAAGSPPSPPAASSAAPLPLPAPDFSASSCSTRLRSFFTKGDSSPDAFFALPLPGLAMLSFSDLTLRARA